jgi:DnaK suppressor protein
MDELTEQQVAELRKALQDLEMDLDAHLAGSMAGAATVDLDQPIGRVSRGDALLQQAMVQENRRRAEVRRLQVRQALRALDDDEYGYCRRCEEPIAHARLAARPEAPFCIRCAGSVESRLAGGR